MDNKRQAKYARQLQKEMSEIFLREGKNMFGNGFISVTTVRVTPDLGLARFYLSFLNEKDPQKAVNLVRQYTKELRTLLAARIKSIVRKIPDIEFFYDDTLDVAERIDKLLDDIATKPKSQHEIDPDEYKD